MEIVYGYEQVTEPLGPIVMTIGTYDGLHVGHRAIIEQVVERARKTGRRSLVYSFYPPPWRVLGRGEHPYLILTLKDKIRLMAELGVDVLVTEEFTPKIQVQSHEAFARDVLRERLAPAELHFGYDFRFGEDRLGDAAFLKAFLAEDGVDVRPHGAVRVNGQIAGCTVIRKHVCSGDVAGAVPLLGRYHFVRGVVVKGRQRGRTIGFPTANVAAQTELLPPPGVYAVQMRRDGHEGAIPGVANLGFRPTFDEQDFSLEVHLLDFEGDLYGERVCVDFVDRVREERRFSGADALVAQIKADVASVRERLPYPTPGRSALSWDPKPQ